MSIFKSKRLEERKLGIIKDYYDVDEDNKIVYLKFKYKNKEELYQTNFDTKEPMLKDDVIDDMSKAIDFLPLVYKADILVELDEISSDKDLIEVQNALEKFQNLKAHSIITKINGKQRLAFILMVIGIFFLICNIILLALSNHYNWDEAVKDIISEVLDIIAWVFVWESVTVSFVERVDLQFKLNYFKNRVNSINVIKTPSK